MKKNNWKMKLVILFIALSCTVYTLHYLIFRDNMYIFKTVIVQLGFLPLSTLLVTFVLNKLINHNKKQELMEKLNMVIGCFFAEMGDELIKIIIEEQPNLYERAETFNFSDEWTKKEFTELKNKVKNENLEFSLGIEGIKRLKEFLVGRRKFMLNLLQNSNLLEHQSFTDLLWSVFHLTEELSNRKNIDYSSEEDLEHISNDISRVYGNLILEWVNYIEHLQKEYPYLFSLAVRTNPFNKEAKVEIE
ncbi:hypothetical protein [Clostridium ganghwense]|uniref:Uncharacterized protein n=1 Tax=Clostridium ganghwense TaxID=312089 RepID=A0ABT4CPV8_9CLOT|nr:hypothetical protein [Clostridium ganghwense]MCY6371094.1 hypothetical protein [Clostridium ganghwense]